MKAVVLGATGHVGNAFVRHLLEEGWDVTVTTRSAVPASNIVGLDAQVVTGEPGSSGAFRAWFRGADLIVDAAAPYHLWMNEARTNDAVQRMDDLLDAVVDCGARLIYVSSFTTILEGRDGYERLQRGAMALAHPYFELKRQLEARVLAASGRGLEAVVVNPTQCIGPWDCKPVDYCLIPALLKGAVPATSTHEINVIDVRDVAAIAVAALHMEIFGQPILLAGHNTTLDVFMARACALGGVRPPSLRVWSGLSAWMAYGNEVLGAASPLMPAYPSLGMILLLAQQWCFPSREQRATNRFVQALSRSLIDSIDWYREIGYAKG